MKSVLLVIAILFSLNYGFTENNYDVKINYIQFDIPAFPESDIDNQEITTNFRISNMFDGKTDTAFEISGYCEDFFLSIVFESAIPIDNIKIYNGNAKSIESYRNNFRYINGSLGLVNIDEFNQNKYYIGTNYSYPDENKFFNISVTNKENKYNYVSIGLSSFYTNFVKTDKVYISEIEFWYKGKRYNIVNLDKLEKELEEIHAYNNGMNGHGWKRKYQLETPIQYKQKPKWYEFWKK